MKHKWVALLAIVGLFLVLPTLAAPQTFVKHTIKDFWEGVSSVYAADVDGDGDVDVVAAARHPSNGLSWWENDGDENFTEHHIAVLDDGHSVQATDVDGDGDLDIVAQGSGFTHGGTHWWENTPSGRTPPEDPITWTRETIWSVYGTPDAYATDMDGDGDADVLMTTGAAHQIYLFENRLGEPTPWISSKIIGPPPPCPPPYYEGCFLGAQTVYAADFDGDDDMDVVGGAEPYEHGIRWWERDVGGWIEHFVTAENTHDIYATDVDGDEDVDIVTARFHGDSIRWWENDGAGTFTGHTIRDGFIRATSVYAADMDWDGDVDIVGTGEGADVIAWWESEPSALDPPDDPITWTEHVIEGGIYGQSVYAIDMDGDGDTDVLGVDGSGHSIAWWENTTEQPAFCDNDGICEPELGEDPAWCPDCSGGLISYWAFDEGQGLVAYDNAAIGHSNDGSLINGPRWVSGVVGAALEFDGVDDYVSTSNNGDSLSIPSGGVSISAWIRPYDVSGNRTFIAKDKEDVTSRGNYHLKIVEGYLEFGFAPISTGSDNLIRTLNPVIVPGNSYHVAVTHTFGDPSSTAIYVNCVSQPLSSWEGDPLIPEDNPMTFAGDPLYIGRSICDGDHFEGIVDEVKVHDRVLAPEELVPGDMDEDGVGDLCDNCPHDFNPDQTDEDQDGVGDLCDNCHTVPNPDQNDSGDGDCAGPPYYDDARCGDACDCDDGICDGRELGDDYFGDPVCAPPGDPLCDFDGDTIPTGVDNCPLTPNSDQYDSDSDGIGDACDDQDTDGDGVCDGIVDGIYDQCEQEYCEFKEYIVHDGWSFCHVIGDDQAACTSVDFCAWNAADGACEVDDSNFCYWEWDSATCLSKPYCSYDYDYGECYYDYDDPTPLCDQLELSYCGVNPGCVVSGTECIFDGAIIDECASCDNSADCLLSGACDWHGGCVAEPSWNMRCKEWYGTDSVACDNDISCFWDENRSGSRKCRADVSSPELSGLDCSLLDMMLCTEHRFCGPYYGDYATVCVYCTAGVDQCPDTPEGIPVDEFGCPLDSDGDGVYDHEDNCPTVYNAYQLDADGDGVGDACDNCVDTYNPEQADTDSAVYFNDFNDYDPQGFHFGSENVYIGDIGAATAVILEGEWEADGNGGYYNQAFLDGLDLGNYELDYDLYLDAGVLDNGVAANLLMPDDSLRYKFLFGNPDAGTVNVQYWLDGVLHNQYQVVQHNLHPGWNDVRVVVDVGSQLIELHTNGAHITSITELPVQNTARLLFETHTDIPSAFDNVLVFDQPIGDGVGNACDKCPATGAWYATESLKANHYDSSNLDLQLTFGCGADQILYCKPGANTGELRFGCSQGTIDVWMAQDPESWALDCQTDGVVAQEGARKPILEDTDGHGLIDLIDVDNDNDGLSDSEDDMIDDADLPGQQGYGTPDWYEE
jgi:hypothetical protein